MAKTPATIGIGLVKLERGLFEEATSFFRTALDKDIDPLQARIGLAYAFLGCGENVRVSSLLAQIEREHQAELELDPNLRSMWETLAIQVSVL